MPEFSTLLASLSGLSKQAPDAIQHADEVRRYKEMYEKKGPVEAKVEAVPAPVPGPSIQAANRVLTFDTVLKTIQAMSKPETPAILASLGTAPFVPENWDALVGALYAHGIRLPNNFVAAKNIPLTSELYALPDAEIRHRMVCTGHMRFVADAVIARLRASAPTVPMPSAAPGEGQTWAWDSTGSKWYLTDVPK